MRLLQLKAKPEGLELSRDFYDSTVIPRLRTVKGCRFARLIQNRQDKTELISMTLWESEKEAEDFEKSPVFEQIMFDIKPLLAESSEWKVQLSEKMELEYKPEIEEPTVQSFPVSTQKDLKSEKPCDSSPVYMRIVSHKLQKGKLSEFKTLYRKEIIPVLQKIEGCCYAYLMENLQSGEEILSVTIWDSRWSAEDYERSGQFDRLVEKVKHTFSQLNQWKMALSKDPDRKAKTSDDTKVDHYQIVSKQNL